MSISPGTRLGPYEIVAAIGAGGMGEVYRAHDTKLGRDVAIKVLPSSLTSDPDRLARFAREAQVLASLNHPNIAAIYGLEGRDGLEGPDGSHAIIMELVEGETLADRIARGPIPIDEALPIARQIAEALEAAHEQGIIHRDLKPANIKVTPDGRVKVLDFGLAKLAESAGSGQPAASSAHLSLSPTITSPALMTGVGVLLGTAAYMAPEQARGRVVDKRSDIWAFGCVLFEMLSGRRAFDGEDVAVTLAAVIQNDPPWEALPAATPLALRVLLRRMLAKDPRERLRDAGDARLEIEAARRGDVAPVPGVTVARSRRWRFVLTGAIGGAIIAVGGYAAFGPRATPVIAAPIAFNLTLPDDMILGANARPVVSPDGQQIAVAAMTNGQRAVWVRAIGSVAARPLPGTADAADVFWSPDSRSVAFVAGAGPNGFNIGQLKRIDVAGGPPMMLCNLPGPYRGGTWSKQGTLLFAAGQLGLWTVPATGGAPARLATGELGLMPWFLPDGRHFLYTRSRAVGTAAGSGVFVGSLDGASQETAQPLLSDQSGAAYVPGADADHGYLLLVRNNSLIAQSFDAKRLQLTGAVGSIADDVAQSAAVLPFSASTNGAIAFRGRAASGGDSRLVWVDRRGAAVGQVGPPASYGMVRLSVDGKTAVVDGVAPKTGGRRVSVMDVRRGTSTVLNPGIDGDTAPIISPGGRIAFTSASGDIYVRDGSGAAEAQLLVKSSDTKHSNDWSRDGRFLIYDDHHPPRQQDLFIVPMTGDRKPIPFVATTADETEAAFSPDGKWIAYSSDESGRCDVYVRDFVPGRVPATGGMKIALSIAGGYKPRWRPDGRELYYLTLDGMMMSVPVTISGPHFDAGIPVALFKTNTTGFFPYDVAADGRFLVNTLPDSSVLQSPMTVMLNWPSLLKQR